MTRTRTHNEEARQPAVQAGFGSFINSRTAKCEAMVPQGRGSWLQSLLTVVKEAAHIHIQRISKSARAHATAMVLPPILYQLVPSVIRLTEDPSVSASDVVAVDAASLAMVLVTDGVMTMLLVTDGVMAMELVTSVVTPIVPSTVVTASVVVSVVVAAAEAPPYTVVVVEASVNVPLAVTVLVIVPVLVAVLVCARGKRGSVTTP